MHLTYTESRKQWKRMSNWLQKCKRFIKKWMRRSNRRQSNNYRWSRNWRKESISFLWSQYFNQALSLSETWSFLIQKLSYMFLMISLNSQTFEKHCMKTILLLKIQKFQFWVIKMWLYELQKKFYNLKIWFSAWTLLLILFYFLFLKRKTSTEI